jgi:hypothetical protein
MYILCPSSRHHEIIKDTSSSPLPATITFLKPPEDIYSLPLNESCRIEYLDPSSDNLCWTEKGLCLDTYNCPSVAMCHFNPQATLAGFLSWYRNGASEYVAAETVSNCQREVFKDKVDYAIRKQKDLIPDARIPCGEEGRDYPISSEGCAVTGSHGIAACKQLKLFVKVVRFTTRFFPLVEAAKTYIDLCLKRFLGTEICQL